MEKNDERVERLWWMVITIPTLTILIYFLTKKSMKGLSILSIIFGIAVIASWILAYPAKGNINLLLGIIWFALGIGWFFITTEKEKDRPGR